MNWYNIPLRHQDPTTGRWNGIDPVTHFSSSTYAGYNNNPVFWADPSGANVWCQIKLAVGVTLSNPYARSGIKGAMRLNQARKFFNGGGNKGGRVFTAGNQMAWLDARAEAAAGGVSGGGNVSVSSVPAIIIGGIIKESAGTISLLVTEIAWPLIKRGGEKLWDAGTEFIDNSDILLVGEYSEVNKGRSWKENVSLNAGEVMSFSNKKVIVSGFEVGKKTGTSFGGDTYTHEQVGGGFKLLNVGGSSFDEHDKDGKLLRNIKKASVFWKIPGYSKVVIKDVENERMIYRNSFHIRGEIAIKYGLMLELRWMGKPYILRYDGK